VKITATGPAYYHHDGLGSTIALTGENGELLESYRYDAFGAATILSPSTLDPRPSTAFGNRFLFTGREWLSQVGLYDYRNRVYSAQIGRFLQTDPIRFAAGDVNIYRYVSNDPLNLWDPWGLYWFRQPWQEPGVIGRDNTMVPPGGPISECIEQYVPAGYTFGQLHDAFVGAATGAGFPDWLVNIPSMPSAYRQALITEVLRSLGILEQPSPLNESTTYE
jgi:RHS repeat-associated protein